MNIPQTHLIFHLVCWHWAWAVSDESCYRISSFSHIDL